MSFIFSIYPHFAPNVVIPSQSHIVRLLYLSAFCPSVAVPSCNHDHIPPCFTFKWIPRHFLTIPLLLFFSKSLYSFLIPFSLSMARISLLHKKNCCPSRSVFFCMSHRRREFFCRANLTYLLKWSPVRHTGGASSLDPLPFFFFFFLPIFFNLLF